MKILTKAGVAAAAIVTCLAPAASWSEQQRPRTSQSAKCDDIGAFPCEIQRRAGQRRFERGPGDVTVNPYSTERDAVRSISQALSIVRHGGRIFVYPGVYRERLAITKDVEIIGINIDITPGTNPSFITQRDVDPGVIVAPPASIGSIDRARLNSAKYHFADEPCLFMRRNVRAVLTGIRFQADALNAGDNPDTRTPCIYVPQGQFEMIGGSVERSANFTANANIPLVQTNGGSVTIRNSKIVGGAEGVWVNANGAFGIDVRLIDNEISQNSEGVRITGQNAFNPVAVNAFISGNIFIANSRYGVLATAGSGAQIIGNTFTANGGSGISPAPTPLADGPVVITIFENDQAVYGPIAYESYRDFRRAVRSTRVGRSLFTAESVAWRERTLTAIEDGRLANNGDRLSLDTERVLMVSAPMDAFPATGCSQVGAPECDAGIHIMGMSSNWTGDHEISGNVFRAPGGFISMSFVGGGAPGYLQDRYLRGVRDNSFPIQEIAVANYDLAREFTSSNRFIYVQNRRRGFRLFR